MPWRSPSSGELFTFMHPVRELDGGHRPPEQEALAEVAPKRVQFGPHGLGLDPFRDDLGS